MLNQLVVVGRLVRDPELRKTENGRNVTNITLAVPRSYKNSNGEYDTDYIDCVLWANVAENTTEYCHKGDLLGTLLLVMQYFLLISLDSFKYQTSFQIVDFCYLLKNSFIK